MLIIFWFKSNVSFLCLLLHLFLFLQFVFFLCHWFDWFQPDPINAHANKIADRIATNVVNNQGDIIIANQAVQQDKQQQQETQQQQQHQKPPQQSKQTTAECEWIFKWNSVCGVYVIIFQQNHLIFVLRLIFYCAFTFETYKNIVSAPVVVNPSYPTTIQTIPELQRPLSESAGIDIVTSRQTQQISTTAPLLLSTYHPAMSKNNEPVKLVYPSKIPNGTINLATISSQSQQQSNIMHTSTSMATNAGSNTLTGQQPQTIVIKNPVLNLFFSSSSELIVFSQRISCQFSY